MFHEGEIAVQERTRQRAAAARLEAAVHGSVPDGASRFLAGVTTAAVCASGPDGRLWASVWLGEPGWLQSAADGATVIVNRPAPADPDNDFVRDALHARDRVGLLAMDFATRRRFRINGTVRAVDDRALTVSVAEAFPNCSMYIQRRQPIVINAQDADVRRSPNRRGMALDTMRRELISRADTAFVASTHPQRGLDVSHRGGPPGFVVAADDRTLLVPDYPGNNMFSTLGNFEVSPHAGIAFVDFDARRLLSVTGDAVISYDSVVAGSADATAGTNRIWRLTVESWMEYDMDGGMRWALLDRSPFNPSIRLQEGAQS